MANVVKPGLSEIYCRGFKFIIMDRPSDTTMHLLVGHLKKANVKDVIRVCEPSYKTDLLEAAGIRVHDWQFDDGSPPPQKIIDQWFNLLQQRLEEDSESCFAVHCVAGLGRGPVMVALALMETGMKYEDTIEFIRDRRRGAFNQKQLKYLSAYKPKNRFKDKRSECAIV